MTISTKRWILRVLAGLSVLLIVAHFYFEEQMRSHWLKKPYDASGFNIPRYEHGHTYFIDRKSAWRADLSGNLYLGALGLCVCLSLGWDVRLSGEGGYSGLGQRLGERRGRWG